LFNALNSNIKHIFKPKFALSYSRFILLAGALIAGGAIVRALSADMNVSKPSATIPEYHLRMFHTHTGESIDVVYRRGDSYVPDALARLNQFLRDHRTGAVHDYDPRLFDLLHTLEQSVGLPGREIDVICGYRSPWSNEFLRRHSLGVAAHSLHMQAEAIDIRIPGISTLALRNAALALHLGGVGYYPVSDFVHVDVGRVRQWSLGAR
jgi:uncharacterized protein YcbK (DUF882 family)